MRDGITKNEKCVILIVDHPIPRVINSHTLLINIYFKIKGRSEEELYWKKQGVMNERMMHLENSIIESRQASTNFFKTIKDMKDTHNEDMKEFLEKNFNKARKDSSVAS